MTRDEIREKIVNIFRNNFEINDPGMDEDLRDRYGFDSIDGIELLSEIETSLGVRLTREEKEDAFGMRTIRQILGYIEYLASRKGLIS